MVEFPKISIKMKNSKTFCEAQTASRLKEIIQPPPLPKSPDQILLFLWNKSFLTEIYRNVQTFAFKELQECSFLASRKGLMQCFFLTLCWKICKVRKVSGIILGAYDFPCEVS